MTCKCLHIVKKVKTWDVLYFFVLGLDISITVIDETFNANEQQGMNTFHSYLHLTDGKVPVCIPITLPVFYLLFQL